MCHRDSTNAVIVGTADHDALMAKASLVVTHGGHGATMRALRHGKPMLVMPGMAPDQAIMAAMVQELGAGGVLPQSSDGAAIAERARAPTRSKRSSHATTGASRPPSERDGPDAIRLRLRRLLTRMRVAAEEPSMTDNTTAFVGSIPENYDRGLGPVIFIDYAMEMAARAAALNPPRVLETAAGTGIVTRQLRDRLPPETLLTATDLNPPMLAVAKTKFEPDEKVDFQTADALALPFAEGAFDAVVCQFGVMFFPDKDLGYREVMRVLAPGGTYLFSVWDTHRYNPFARLVHDTLGGFFPADPPQFMRLPFSYAFEPIKDSLIAAGFRDIQASVVRIEKAIPTAEAFARGQVYGSPIIDQIRARGGVDPEDLVQALKQGLEREFGADPGRMPLQAMFFSAKKP